MSHNTLSTGIISLDKLFSKINPGDTLVWQVDDIKDYEIFVKPFAKYCIEQNQKLVYVSFDSSLKKTLGEVSNGKIEIVEFSNLNTQVDLEKKLVEFIEKSGNGVSYIFDSITSLKSYIDDDQIGKFFEKICRRLSIKKGIAYFAVEKGKHKSETISLVKSSAQIFTEITRMNGNLLLQPIKVSGRYSPNMFKPHLFDDKEITVLDSVDLREYSRRLEEKSLELHKIMRQMEKIEEERRKVEEELRESEKKYRDFYDNAPDMFHSLDKNGIIIDCNETEARMLGYLKEEIIGRPLTDFLTDDSQKLFHEDFPRLKEKGYLLNLEREFVRKDGTIFTASLNVFAEFDDNGELIRTKTIARDITERKKVEEELKESRRALMTLMSNLPGMVYRCANDPKWTMEFVSEGCFELTGYHPEDLIANRKVAYGDLIEPEYRDIVWKGIQKALKQKEPFRLVYRIKTANGEEKWVWEQGRGVFDENGELEALEGFITDITERKKAEEELRALKEFNENMVKNMQEGLLVVDSDDYITYANPKVEEMLGYSKEELIGRQLIEIFSPDYKHKMSKEINTTLKKERKKFEGFLVTKTKQEIPVIISSTPFFISEDYAGVLLVLTDITEMKKAEDSLREQMLKYEVKKGNIYLVKERKLKLTLDVFSDLIKCGYKGLIISRKHPESFKEVFPDGPVIWLSEHSYGENTLRPQVDLIEAKIRDFLTRNSAVLLDRLEYLITQNGFRETLNFIQRLNELFYISKNILIISIDPKTLTSQEISLLEEETHELKLKEYESLSYDLKEILKFIYQENRIGKKPTHTEVINKFNITRATLKKKLVQLENKGLILDIKRGKHKILEITEKGKIFIGT